MLDVSYPKERIVSVELVHHRIRLVCWLPVPDRKDGYTAAYEWCECPLQVALWRGCRSTDSKSTRLLIKLEI